MALPYFRASQKTRVTVTVTDDTACSAIEGKDAPSPKDGRLDHTIIFYDQIQIKHDFSILNEDQILGQGDSGNARAIVVFGPA